MIQIKNITKRFGAVVAVDNISLEIARGELFAFLGPNAAGKTTTIKLIAGLLRPTEGQILIGGYDIQKQYIQAKRLISYVPDIPYLYDKLTAEEFLYFIARLYELNGYDIEKKSKALLELFGLKGYSSVLIEEFSHGMRQRLVMCAAFIHDPTVILIDEPLVGLDPRSGRLLKDILKAKSKEGVTIFMSTHTLNIAEELSDRIGIIDRGRVIALGSFDELQRLSGVNGHLEEVFLKLTQEEIVI